MAAKTASSNYVDIRVRRLAIKVFPPVVVWICVLRFVKEQIERSLRLRVAYIFEKLSRRSDRR